MKLSRKTPIILAWMVMFAVFAPSLVPAACGEDAGPDDVEADWGLIWNFVQATDAVNANLTEIDDALLDASLAISVVGVEGPKAREALGELAAVGPWVVDCITVDLNGTIVEVVPEEYLDVEGINIRDQEQIERLFSTRRSVGLAYIESVEGFYAMDFASPVFDGEGRLIGAVTVLVNSTELFGTVLAPYQPEGSAKIWAMMPDGTIIYDPDAEQIGRNTFSDPLFQPFPDLLAAAARVEMERSGISRYEISGTARDVFWTTAYYQGSEIRILLSVDA